MLKWYCPGRKACGRGGWDSEKTEKQLVGDLSELIKWDVLMYYSPFQSYGKKVMVSSPASLERGENNRTTATLTEVPHNHPVQE